MFIKTLIVLGAVLSAVSIAVFAAPDLDLTDTFTSGDWAKISGGLGILMFAGGAWIARTQRADIQMLRAKVDALIERNYTREARNIETIHSFTAALNVHSENIARLTAAIEKRARSGGGD